MDLRAQHVSHASHASHASGVTGRTPTSTTPDQPDSTSAPNATKSPGTGPASPSANTTKSPNTSPAKPSEPPTQATATITSVPPLADIEIDGKYSGSTSSSIKLTSGSHAITIKKDGYEPWSRTVEITAGSEITINADLKPAQSTPDKKATPNKK
jgi:hypothetical protein